MSSLALLGLFVLNDLAFAEQSDLLIMWKESTEQRQAGNEDARYLEDASRGLARDHSPGHLLPICIRKVTK